MKLITSILAIGTLFTTAFAAETALKNHTQEYYLKTNLKPGQPGKKRFDNLWVYAYHTGAGLDDATLDHDKRYAIKGFLNGTNAKVGDIKYQNQVFDLGTEFPWSMIPEPNVNFYAAWQPVRINAGYGASDPDFTNGGFWINGTGLQWTGSVPKKPKAPMYPFGGWLVCEWWHGTYQLFFRMNYYDDPAPCSCADVWLCPEYI